MQPQQPRKIHLYIIMDVLVKTTIQDIPCPTVYKWFMIFFLSIFHLLVSRKMLHIMISLRVDGKLSDKKIPPTETN